MLLPLWDYVIVYVFCALLYVHSSFGGEERAGCFANFVFQVPRNCCVALSRDAVGLSAFSGLWFFLIILTIFESK